MPGPLVARWLSWSFGAPRAGTLASAHAEIENTGAATWGDDVTASYHWLDERGNAIVWDGLRTPLGLPVAPGERVELDVRVRAPMPPGEYRFALDLVAEHRAWFGELAGEQPPGKTMTVRPRAEATALRDAATVHVPDLSSLSPDWETRALALHREGYAVVGGAVEAPRRQRKALAPWAPGAGPVPGFRHPLLCPSVLHGVTLERLDDMEGLPAFRPPADEPWVYDASLVIRLA